jgi:hypothetical protein
MRNTTHTLRTPATAVLAALALASFGLAACGESSGGSSSQTSAAAKQALERIAKAANAPSTTTTTPQSSTTGTPSRTTKAPQLGKSGGAPSGSTPPRQTAAVSRFKQALEKFTNCLRQNGVPVAKSSGKGLLGLQALDRSSPKYKSAVLKCRGVLSAAFRGAG